MIIEFKFKNAGSFKGEYSLDLSATKSNENEFSLIKYGGERILPISVIYGANASGKSNVFGAFHEMRNYVLTSGYIPMVDLTLDSILDWRYKFYENKENVEFEIFFTINNDVKQYIYCYGFILNEEGVEEEWFYRKSEYINEYKVVFRRGKTKNDLEFNSLTKAEIENIKAAFDKKALLASIGKNIKIKFCEMIFNWFLKTECIDFSRLNIDEEFNHKNANSIRDIKFQKNIIKFVSSFDNSIKGFDISDSEQKFNIYDIKSKHILNNIEYLLEFDCESLGTKKMIYLYQYIQKVFNNGGLLFVDELCASLHPLLVRNLLVLFNNSDVNINHAQLIFTSHDVWLLSSKILRRDEIWFVEKKNDETSELYSLSDFVTDKGDKIRKDESLEKNYMYGKYGAIPNMSTIKLNFEEESNEKAIV